MGTCRVARPQRELRPPERQCRRRGIRRQRKPLTPLLRRLLRGALQRSRRRISTQAGQPSWLRRRLQRGTPQCRRPHIRRGRGQRVSCPDVDGVAVRTERAACHERGEHRDRYPAGGIGVVLRGLHELPKPRRGADGRRQYVGGLHAPREVRSHLPGARNHRGVLLGSAGERRAPASWRRLQSAGVRFSNGGICSRRAIVGNDWGTKF